MEENYILGENGLILVILLAIPIFFAWLLTNLKLKQSFNSFIENKKTTYEKFIIAACFIVIYGVPIFVEKYGNTDINSIFARRNFDFQGYVYVFPQKDAKEILHLKADMQKSGKYFFINKIYFNKDKYIEIVYDESNPLFKTGELQCTYDYNKKDWCFRFYGEQVK